MITHTEFQHNAGHLIFYSNWHVKELLLILVTGLMDLWLISDHSLVLIEVRIFDDKQVIFSTSDQVYVLLHVSSHKTS